MIRFKIHIFKLENEKLVNIIIGKLEVIDFR